MKKKRKGFTLAELLIVVAIIAVLVAIGIPIFTSLLEKSREAADAANIRAQYAQVMDEAITVDGNVNIDGKDFSLFICNFHQIPLNVNVNSIFSSVLIRYSGSGFAPQLSSPPTPICSFATRTTV